MKRLGTWIASVTLALIALALAVNTERTSPGPLAMVHAREPELSGADSCRACHGGVLQTMADACTECHADVDLRIDGGTGVHGQLAGAVVDDCGSCHREHHGPTFRMVDTATFALAGIEDVDAYDHAGIDYNLVGAHGTLDCEECHPNARVPILPLGEQRFLGTDQSCVTCHEDHHEGEFGTDCLGCHGQDLPFPLVGGAAHATFCPAEGAHAETECIDCHAEGGPWSVEALVERHLRPQADDTPSRSCEDCHASPHRDLFVRNVARLTRGESWTTAEHAGPPPAADDLPLALAAGRPAATVETAGLVCARCHSPTDEQGFLGRPEAMTDDWHRASGFALVEPHDGLACEDCHADLGERAPAEATPRVPGGGGAPADERPVDFSAWREDYPGRGPDACHTCHGDPHEQQFDRGPFAGVGCLGCHERTSFDPPLFDLEHHARTDFVLEGSHAAADCEACHVVPDGLPAMTADGTVTRVFAGTQGACAECHADPHSLPFLDGVAALAGLGPEEQTCTECHDAARETFVGEAAELTQTLHAASGFELTGPHGEVECIECHDGYGRRKVAQAYGTGLGKAADGPPRAAPGPDVTAGALAAGVEADTDGFDEVSRLLAESGVLPFAEIPGPNPGSLPDEAPARLEVTFDGAYPGRPADACQSCHEDPHEDQFERGAYADAGCITCHSRSAFTPPLFAEELHAATDFPLTGAHVAVGCNECHVLPDELSAERRTAMVIVPEEARVFVDTPDVCSSCHEDVHDGRFDRPGLPARLEGRESCARCHVTDSFGEFHDGRFDHGLWSGFLLEGAHGRLDCVECHVPSGTPDEFGRTFGEARGTSCADCHQDDHVGQFAVEGVTDCTRCHIVGSGFDELVFDHQTDSRFALDENHVTRSCDQCHKPYPLVGGGEAVRYKPLGTECRDCHDPASLPPDAPRRPER